jgi:Ser/Thr protein kinase RdoA (MazF antagonist)
MHVNIANLLEARYGLKVLSCAEVPAGWSAAALKARTARGDYFVKVYDRGKPSTRIWVERLDRWLPAAQWLGENTPLSAHMSVPVRAKDGAFRVDNGDSVILVYPYIEGETLCEKHLEPDEARELGRIVGLLHEAKVPLPMERLTETYEFPFGATLRARFSTEDGLARVLAAPHASLLAEKIDELTERVARLKRKNPKKVLCHTDIHGWNLMRDKRLILVDWEGLTLAPPEADFFLFTETYFFGYAWNDILAGYRAVRPDFVLDEDALKTYCLRRRLEDIGAFLESLAEDALSPDETARTKALFARECGYLKIS